jgi:hypothetical protein
MSIMAVERTKRSMDDAKVGATDAPANTTLSSASASMV